MKAHTLPNILSNFKGVTGLLLLSSARNYWLVWIQRSLGVYVHPFTTTSVARADMIVFEMAINTLKFNKIKKLIPWFHTSTDFHQICQIISENQFT